VSGANVSSLVQALCGRSLRPREAHYLPFLDGAGGAVDHGLAIHFPAPNSFTGEDVLELQAHGGPVVLQLLLSRCLDAAAQHDPLTGEPGLRKADASGQLVRLRELLEAVQRRARQGALLREGIKVVIAGQPNAGKSSLLNALAGAELAIVSSVAGTTRDVVAQTIQIHGVPVHVADTAGLRESSDEVEQIGIARAWGQIESADAVLFLHDLIRADMPDYALGDAGIAQLLAEKLPASVPVLHIWNKSDAVPADESGAARDGISLSAKNGQGLEVLRERLLQVAGWQAGPEGVYLARARHVQALARVGEHLGAAAQHLAMQDQMLDLLAEELRLAQMALNEITGEFGADDLLGVIFSRFCIGK
jgi:tRNA modification GTPase